ncbi:MAG: ribokinase [Pseudomonadota bacterium]
MTHIAVLGSINLDLSASVSRLPAPGETVTGATLSRFPGGKGANQALAARRLGADVSLIGCVGDDSAADEALALLKEGGVDLTRCVRHASAATGIALIAVAESGENQIVVAPGANAELEPDAVDLPDADALICQLEIPRHTIVDVAERFDGFFVVNLAPARQVDVSILQRADLIIVNETEAAWYGSSLGACGGLVATTYGAAGAALHKDGKEIARAEAPAVKAIDTVGAGDTFTAALTLRLVESEDPASALRFACAAGAAATLARGAQPALPTSDEVAALL